MFISVAAMELSCDITGQTHRHTDTRTQPFIVKDYFDTVYFHRLTRL